MADEKAVPLTDDDKIDLLLGKIAGTGEVNEAEALQITEYIDKARGDRDHLSHALASEQGRFRSLMRDHVDLKHRMSSGGPDEFDTIQIMATVRGLGHEFRSAVKVSSMAFQYFSEMSGRQIAESVVHGLAKDLFVEFYEFINDREAKRRFEMGML